MHRIAIHLIAVLLVSACDQQSDLKDPQEAKENTVHEFHGVETVLLVGQQNADVMQLMAPREAQEFSTKIQNAAVADPQWWQAHIKTAEPGQPLPYDPKLGVTEAEYDRFLELSNKFTMQKQAEAELTITKTSDGKFVLDGGTQVPNLTGIQVDLQGNAVTTPYGIATKRSEIDAPEDSALGKWKGVQWSFEQFDEEAGTGAAVKLSVGTHRNSGRGIIYYDVKHAAPNSEPEVFFHVLMFHVPGAKPQP